MQKLNWKTWSLMMSLIPLGVSNASHAYEHSMSAFEIGAGSEAQMTGKKTGTFLLKVSALHATDTGSEVPIRFILAHTDVEVSLDPNGSGASVVNRAQIRFEPFGFGAYHPEVGQDVIASGDMLPMEWQRDLALNIDSKYSISVAGVNFQYNLDTSDPLLIPIGRATVDLLGIQLLKQSTDSLHQFDAQLGSVTLEIGAQYGATNHATVSLVAGTKLVGAVRSQEVELYSRLRSDLGLAFLGADYTDSVGVFLQLGQTSEYLKGSDPRRVVRITAGIAGKF